MKSIILLWIAALVAAWDAPAASFVLQPVRNIGAGAASQDSRFKVTASIGQPFTLMPTGRVFSIRSGFWPVVEAPAPASCPSIQNPGFELITPPPPPGGTAFGLATVPGWTALNTEASLHGLGGLSACEGTNYAGLRGEVVNGIFKSGALEGRLTHPLAQGGAHQFMACLALARGAGAWVEFVLSDGNPAHEQVITREFAEHLGSWQSLTRGVTIPITPGEVPGVRFTASHPHDRIIIRTIPTYEGRASDGNVFVDDLRLGCFAGLVVGTTAPRSLTIRWTGDGILQSAASLGPNAVWTDANVAITHDGNVHQAIIPTDGNAQSQFFRLRLPPPPPGL